MQARAKRQLSSTLPLSAVWILVLVAEVVCMPTALRAAPLGAQHHVVVAVGS